MDFIGTYSQFATVTIEPIDLSMPYIFETNLVLSTVIFH